MYYDLRNQLRGLGYFALQKTQKVKAINDENSKIFMETLFPQDLQNVGHLIHFITYVIGNNYKINAFTDGLINVHFYFKMTSLSTKETGSKLEEYICAWQTNHFNATELCTVWQTDAITDNRVRNLQRLFSQNLIDCVFRPQIGKMNVMPIRNVFQVQ